MGFQSTDLINNAPLFVLVATGLVVILIEATKTGRPTFSFLISIIGLVMSGLFAITGLTVEDVSFGGMLTHGSYANFFSLVFCIAAVLAILYTKPYLERLRHHRGDYYILILFATMGMMLMASANDLIIIFLGIELMSVCLYVLAGFMRMRDRSNESAIKYFLLGAFATGFLLYGIALIYGSIGSTNITIIHQAAQAQLGNPLFLIGVGLVMVGLSFKVAAVPFHMWAPDVYEGAPTPVTAFMATAAKAAAFAAFVTVFIRMLNFVGTTVNDVLALLAAASMIVGNVIAIAQSNIKRMLAYSSIAHAGYMLAGIAAANPEGQAGVMFYLAAYAFMNLGAFGIVSLIEKEEERNLKIDDYAGLSAQHPAMAALMAMFMFSLAGIPPLAGFFGKYYVFLAAVKANMTWLAIVGVLMSLVSAYYYLRIVVVMYFREGTATLAARPTLAALIALAISAFFVLQLGVYPSFALRLMQPVF